MDHCIIAILQESIVAAHATHHGSQQSTKKRRTVTPQLSSLLRNIPQTQHTVAPPGQDCQDYNVQAEKQRLETDSETETDST